MSKGFESQDNKSNTDSKLNLLEEQLTITKEWVKNNDVSIRKVIEEEEKWFTIPITCEVLLIEKKNTSGDTETTRIPIREEQVEISKHFVDLNDISVYKNQFNETQPVEETLKKEKLVIRTNGNPSIVYTGNIDKN